METRPEPVPWTWLIDARVEARKTAAQVAREAGLSKNYYCQVEAGTRRLVYNLDKLGRIADAIGVKVSDLDKNRPPAQPGQRQRRNGISDTATSTAAAA